MVKGIAHLCIRVTDLERTARFYCDGLGLEKAFDFILDGEVVGFYLRVGNGNFLEFFRREPVESGPNPLDHLALETDSIDAVNARLAATGYPVGEKKMGADHAWQAWLTDPDGVRIELHEYTADSCQRTGENWYLPSHPHARSGCCAFQNKACASPKPLSPDIFPQSSAKPAARSHDCGDPG